MSLATALRKGFDQGVGTLAAGSHIRQLGGGKSVTGQSVTTERAMRFGAFWSAVRILAESVAMLPLSVYRARSDGSRELVRDHPVGRLIHDLPNPQMTSFAWREVGMTHLATWGNAFSLQVRDGTGQLRQLWPLAPDRMEVSRAGDTGDLRYRYSRKDGRQVDLGQEEIFHVTGLSWDGIQGYSLIRQARDAIALGLAAEEFGGRFFAHDTTAGVVLRHPKTLSDTARANLQKSWKARHQGLERAWEPAILEEDMSLERLDLPPADAQFLETRKFQVAEIARWFRIPPHMLADLDRATFSNVEELAREFVGFTLMPWLGRWEQAIGMQLLRDEWQGYGGDHYVRFNVGALVRGDIKTRYAAYATGRQWGFLSANQIAELEDWDPIPGGDEYLVPLNMTTANPDGSITTATMAARKDSTPPGALRCAGCERLLAEEISPPYRLVCGRCKTVNEGA